MSTEMISPEQERTVFEAVRAAIREANAGVDPSEAIAKQASARHLTPEFAGRMVEAFNVSKTLKQLQSAQGEEKLASFTVADPGKVLSLMYPGQVATPGQKEAAQAPSDVGLYHGTVKLASDLADKHATVAKSAQVSDDLHSILGRAYSVRDQLRRTVKSAEQAEMGLHREVIEAVDKVASYFRDPYHAPFSEVDEVVWGHFGDDGKGLMDAVHGLVKAAGFKFTRAQRPDPCIAPRDQEPYSYVYEAMDKRAEYVRSVASAAEAREEQRIFESRLCANEQALIKAGAEGSSLGGRVMDMAAGGFALDSMKETLSDPPQSKGDAVGKMLETVSDPKFEGQRQSLDATMLLHNLMTTDPVIKHHPPQRVIAAYNELAASYPGLVKQPVSLRVYLSKLLEGRLDAYDVTSATGVEKDIRQADQPPRAMVVANG